MSKALPGSEIRVETPRKAVKKLRTRQARRRELLRQAAEAPSLGHLTWTLREYRWTIVATVVLALGLAVLRLLVATPSYESSVLIQVEGRTKTVPGFRDVSPLFDAESSVEAQMRIMRSRPLLQSVAEDLKLYIEVRPRTVPIIGRALARYHKGPDLAAPRLGLTSRAWGGERIRVDALDVSAELLDEPLVLTALDEGRYQVAAPELGVILAGEVGKPAATPPGTTPHVEILVAELVPRPGTEFVAQRSSTAGVVDALQSDLSVAQQGDTGVVELSLVGSDPARGAAILNAVANAYVSQNVERTSAEATKTLRYLEAQLPALQAGMEKAERTLHAFRRQHGTVNLSVEGESFVTQGAEMDRRISELQVEAAELHQRYTETHPAVLALENRLSRLRAQRAALDERMRSLPSVELDSARLTRNARFATELYLNVQLRAQELRIVNAGWIGSVRILEPAVAPTRASSPKREATLALGLVLGLAAGVWAAFMRKGLENGVEDPDEIEVGTGLRVFGAIPRSSAQRALERRVGWLHRPLEPLALAAPGDRAVEDLRSLRTSVQFALLRAKNNVITISAPAPRVGKSFVSVNLAHLLAAAGRSVVLVDADLRRGQLQRYFQVERDPGLSDVLRRTATLDEAIRTTDAPRLSFLGTGTLPQDPAELAASERTRELLEELSRRFDVVVVDTPPILSVTDSALIARHAGVNLLVVRAGEQTIREIAFTLRRLAQNGVTIRGAILNDVRTSRGRYGRYGEYPVYSTQGVPRE